MVTVVSAVAELWRNWPHSVAEYTVFNGRNIRYGMIAFVPRFNEASRGHNYKLYPPPHPQPANQTLISHHLKDFTNR